MKKNHSPWLNQLKRVRQINQINKNDDTDILIIGAGIAGVLTSYQILKNTNNNIILIDCNLAGHGASGHNAGQLTTYFERPLADIAKEFGVDLACRAQKDVESAWDILEEIKKDLNLKTPIYKFTGYAGMTDLSQVLLHLTDNLIRYDGGIEVETLFISESFKYLKDIPSIFSHLYTVTSHKDILDKLETDNDKYIASLAYPKGATNSANLCEEIIEYMLLNFQDRFSIYENSPVNKIFLDKDEVVTEVVMKKIDTLVSKEESDFTIKSKKVVLCTNGFEGFSIINNSGMDIDTKFHHQVRGRVNFMSAYIDKIKDDPAAIAYFSEDIKDGEGEENVTGDPYFYITRRPYIHEGDEVGLISTGGPERVLQEEEAYNRDGLCEDWAEKEIDNFLKKNYRKHKKGEVYYDFCWHGLLGYTNTGLRLIGKEPLNENLIYNLGCNGIGIMPSVFASLRVAKLLNGEILEKSIFDPNINKDNLVTNDIV